MSMTEPCTDLYIEQSKVLDFDVRPRPRKGYVAPGIPSEILVLTNCKRLTEAMKWSMIAVCADLGLTDVSNFSRRREILGAVIRTMSYNYGFETNAISLKYFESQWNKFKYSLKKDPCETFAIFESNVGRNRGNYVEYLSSKFPWFLHQIYRYTISVIGATANAESITEMMNTRSRLLFPNCPIRRNLGLTKFHFWKFFHHNNFKVLSPTSKPRLTPKQRKEQILWVRKWKLIFEDDPNAVVCFLDEKFFYIISRRKKMKVLPKAQWETHEE